MAYIKYDGSAAAPTTSASKNFYGTTGADTLTGTSGSDGLWGGQGDRLAGGGGDDTYYLKSLNDRVVEQAGQGVDKLVAWSNVYLLEYPNIENLSIGGDKTYGAGSSGDNIIEGQAGSQQIYGGGGQDVLAGGAGADVFIVYKGEGNDVIQDFNAAEDKVRLKAGLSSFDQVKARLSQTGADVKLDLGGGDGLIFRNLSVGQLSASNFQLELNPATLGARTFADEFSAPLSLWDKESNPTGVWRPDFGYQGSQGYGSYTLPSVGYKQIFTSPYFRDHPGDFAENPFVSNADGTLSIFAKPSTNPEIFGYGYISGLITTKESFSQTYGYFEMRADLPEAAGTWPAFWLLPKDGSWPPELDIMEVLGHDTRDTWTTEHSKASGAHTSHGLASFTPDTADGFHTYGALWTPTEIVWYVDKVEVFRTPTPADMNKPMFILANMGMGGWAGTVDNAALPAEMKIDYIRAYALGAPNAPPPTQPPPTQPPPTQPPPTDPTSGLVLTSTKYGQALTGGAGADTLTGGKGGEIMTGGAGGDVFVFKPMPAGSAHATVKDFQLGTDKLDLSALLKSYTGSDPVADRWLFLSGDGAGGTKVLVDIDGPAATTPWPQYVAHLQGVSPTGLTAAKLAGGAPAPAPIPQPAPEPTPEPTPDAGLTLTSTKFGAVLTGGAGADTLTGGKGGEVMTGGAGGDVFVFEPMAQGSAHATVTDFQGGVDKLDVSALLDQAGYTGSNPIADGYVKLYANGQGDTWLFFDRDGVGTGDRWGSFMATIENVAPSSIGSGDWIF